MADHKATKKDIKQTAKRTARNKSRTNRIRTVIKTLEAAILSADKDKILKQFKIAQSEIMRGVVKGVLKKNTASRKVSKLAAKMKTVA